MSQNDLFLNLLRPAVLHILRATGFHYGKPSAVDTVVDLTARYLTLLAERTGLDIYVKHENHNPTSAFKIRGGLNLVRSLSPEERARGLVTASTDLYSRVARLDQGAIDDEPAQSPARALMGRLERDLIWNRGA